MTDVLERPEAQTAEKSLKVVGTRPIRPDGVDKVTGRAAFGADLALPGMLVGRIKRSPHAHARIAVSEAIAGAMRRCHGRSVEAIPNGVALTPVPASTGALDRFGLEPGRYVAMVGRLVPEKRHLDLVEAFGRAPPPGWKLALVGGALCLAGVVVTRGGLRRRRAPRPPSSPAARA